MNLSKDWRNFGGTQDETWHSATWNFLWNSRWIPSSEKVWKGFYIQPLQRFEQDPKLLLLCRTLHVSTFISTSVCYKDTQYLYPCFCIQFRPMGIWSLLRSSSQGLDVNPSWFKRNHLSRRLLIFIKSHFGRRWDLVTWGKMSLWCVLQPFAASPRVNGGNVHEWGAGRKQSRITFNCVDSIHQCNLVAAVGLLEEWQHCLHVTTSNYLRIHTVRADHMRKYNHLR